MLTGSGEHEALDVVPAQVESFDGGRLAHVRLLVVADDDRAEPDRDVREDVRSAPLRDDAYPPDLAGGEMRVGARLARPAVRVQPGHEGAQPQRRRDLDEAPVLQRAAGDVLVRGDDLSDDVDAALLDDVRVVRVV